VKRRPERGNWQGINHNTSKNGELETIRPNKEGDRARDFPPWENNKTLRLAVTVAGLTCNHRPEAGEGRLCRSQPWFGAYLRLCDYYKRVVEGNLGLVYICIYIITEGSCPFLLF
jgi:hypothetical protein